jgi:hypothetical protein
LNSERFSALKVFVVSAVGCLIVWAAFPNRKTNEFPAPSNAEIRNEELLIRGLRYKSYSNGVLVAQVEAEEFKIIPRRFLVFQIKSINEAVVTNTKISIFSSREDNPGGGKGMDPFGSLFKEFTNKDSGVGLVTKVIVKGIDIVIYDSDVLTQHLRAASADLRSNGGAAIFYDAVLERPASRTRIKAKKMIWDSREKKFIIPGGHLF